MERETDLYPELNSQNFEKIIKIITSYTSEKDVSFIENILALKSPRQLYALSKILTYLVSKDSLTVITIDFLLETEHPELINFFLYEIDNELLHKSELLEIMDKLSRVDDLKKILERLIQLKSQNIIPEMKNYKFIYSIIELIEYELDEEKYIFLIENSKQPNLIVKALLILKEENLLEKNYIDFISDTETIQSYPLVKALILKSLKENNLLDNESFEICKNHSNLLSLENIINILSERRGYLQKYLSHIMYKKTSVIQKYIHFLKKNQLFNEQYLDLCVILNGGKLDYFVDLLELTNNYLTEIPKNIQLLVNMKKGRLKKLIDAVDLLVVEGYLDGRFLNFILSDDIATSQIYNFAQSCIILHENQLYDIFVHEVYQHPKPLIFTFCIIKLHRHNILSIDNLYKLKKVQWIESYYRLIKQLSNLQILTQENFEHILIISQLLSQENFEKLSLKKNVVKSFFLDIFDLSKALEIPKPDKIQKILSLIDSEQYSRARSSSINPAESTHLASINQSFSKVIEKFKKKYSVDMKALDLESFFKQVENEFETEITEFDSEKFLAAKRALNGIIRDQIYIDDQSGISLEQLFVLLWDAISDESELIGSLADAKKQLLNGLYEIQRGGNINGLGHDNSLPDEPICCKGAFHKLLEKLVGIHKYVDFSYITPEIASLKFPIIVQEEANNYLLNLEHRFIYLNYDRYKEEGVPAIWKYIESKVRQRMLDEFGIIYQSADGITLYPSFERLLSNHQYLDLDFNILNNIKTFYILNNLDSSFATESDCGMTSIRNKRSIVNCLEPKLQNKKFYQPWLIKKEKIRQILSFLVGVLDDSKKNILVNKMKIFEQLKESREINQLETLSDVVKDNLIVTRQLDLVDIVELEDQNGNKKYLNVQQSINSKKKYYNIYSPEINGDRFLPLNEDIELNEIIELYVALLFPEETFCLIKQNLYKYSSLKLEVISKITPYINSQLNFIKPSFHIESTFELLIINEDLWPFFSVDEKPITDSSQFYLINLDLNKRFVNFKINKIIDVFKLSTLQQINLGKILNSHYVTIESKEEVNSNVFQSQAYSNFRIKLLEKLIEQSKKNLLVDHEMLVNFSQEYFYSELGEYINNDEINLILENNIKAHENARINLKPSTGAMRQTTIMMPALLQALNGHTENLEKMAALMSSDLSFNQAYQNLIKSPIFFNSFPKIANILKKTNFVIISPVSKLLLLNSFYELTDTLIQSKSTSPEYQLAKNLLTDNSLVLGTMFLESLGLELGVGGVIIDLGITIHQLISTVDYLRKKLHLYISLWEGIKYELSFSSIIPNILKEREILYNYLNFINSFLEKYRIPCQFLLLKIPETEEKPSIQITKNELPSDVQSVIQTNRNQLISTFKYKYSKVIPTSFYRLPNPTLYKYEKKQYSILHKTEAFLVKFSSASNQIHENNVFTHSLENCQYLYSYPCVPTFDTLCTFNKVCTKTPFSIENWFVSASTKKSIGSNGSRFQKKSHLTIENQLGGLLEINSQPYQIEDAGLLILFCPLYGNMSLIGGNFLENKVISILIHKSIFDDNFIDDRSIAKGTFLFKNMGFANETQYLVSPTNSEGFIYDDTPNILIKTLDLEPNSLPNFLMMISNNILKFGALGANFFGINLKKNIKIILSNNYFLKGNFYFLAESVQIENVRVLPSEQIIFKLIQKQFFSIKHAVGEFFFIFDEGLIINVYIKRMYYETKLKKDLNTFQVNTYLYINDLNIFNITDNNPSNNFEINWKVNTEVFFYIKGYLGSTNFKIILEGNFLFNNKSYRAQLNFGENQWSYLFFDLMPLNFLLSNTNQLKETLSKGLSYFLFMHDNHINRIDYVNNSFIKYKKISYQLCPLSGLLVTNGEPMAAVHSIESFQNVLKGVAIDLRRQGLIQRTNTSTLKVGNRYLVDIPLDNQLLTDQGVFYMGLLPKLNFVHNISERKSDTQVVDFPFYHNKQRRSVTSSATSEKELTNLILGAGLITVFLGYKDRLLDYKFIMFASAATSIYNFIPSIATLFKGANFESSSLTKLNIHSSTSNQPRIKIFSKLLWDTQAYMKTTSLSAVDDVNLSDWLDTLSETSNKTVNYFLRNKRVLPATNSSFEPLNRVEKVRDKNSRVEPDVMTSSAIRSEGWLNSIWKLFFEPLRNHVQPLFLMNKQRSVVLAPVKESIGQHSIVLKHCIPGVRYGDTYRKGITCYSQNMQMLIFPKNNDVKMATLNDTYSRQSLRPVECNGRPAVYFEGEKTHIFYIPEIPENPLDRFNDQLFLLQVLFYEAKKFYSWCKNLFVRKSDQLQLLVKESVKTSISNEIKTSWKERLKYIEKQLDDVKRLARDKLDLDWIKNILQDRKEEFNHLNQLSHTHLEIINAFTENLQVLQSELLEIRIDLDLTKSKQAKSFQQTTNNMNIFTHKPFENSCSALLKKNSVLTPVGLFSSQSCRKDIGLLGYSSNKAVCKL